MTLRVSDHALVRFLERAGGVDFEPVRAAIAAGLSRGVAAAHALGQADVDIVADGYLYVVRDGVLVTMRPVARRR